MNIDDFKAKLTGGGARANLFKVIINFPGFAGGNSELTSFMCKSASLPASPMGVINQPFRGRVLKLAGDRTFDNWSVNIINDTNFAVRNAFERWHNGISSNKQNLGRVNPADYMADLEVHQLDREGKSLKVYKIRSAWPTNLGAIELSNDTTDAIEEFSVEFALQYWESDTTS